MAGERQETFVTRARLVACFVALALVSRAFPQDKTEPNQAANTKLTLTGKVFTDRKDMKELLGLDPGDGFIVVRIRAVPNVIEPLRLSSDDFMLISLKNGERCPSMRPLLFTRRANEEALLNAKLFPDAETREPVEGLLYFLLDGKFQPKNLGLIYAGAAGRLIIDFR